MFKIEKLYKIYSNQPKRGEVEEYLFKFGTNMYHLLSLLHPRYKGKYTQDYCTYLFTDCLVNVVGALYTFNLQTNSLDIVVAETLLNDFVSSVQAQNPDINDICSAFGAELDSNDNGSTSLFKIASLYYALIKKFPDITWDMIENKYSEFSI